MTDSTGRDAQLAGQQDLNRSIEEKNGELHMGMRSERITDDDYRRAIADALDGAPLRLSLTEGHIVHIEEAEREARKSRIKRRRRRTAP